MGNLLAETEVPVLVLNACRYAHAEAPEKPDDNPDDTEADPHAQTRAFGSLAQEIVDAGTAGVVAMRYNVYVATAAQFVADLYGALIGGNSLGEAATLGRKALQANPTREIAADTVALQDWCVPVAYEACPIVLFPEQSAVGPVKIALADGRATPSRGNLDPDLSSAPDAGFWGRDETLLALDRAFDDHGAVLLHAYAGSGKTAAVAEFARWYALTGGVEGPVLFTSFEHHTPLVRALDKFGRVFGPELERSGIYWLARSDNERREIALQVMAQIPVLWIWDNVEPVAGFPAGAESAWSPEEQRELADFLRAARQTKAKFLLASRRDEKAWLGDLPARVPLPPMPMHEREQMARSFAKKHRRNLRDLQAWRPLLRFSGGNPLTLTVLAGQALRDGMRFKEQIEDFVEKLSRGEQAFEDEETQGRAKSLSASLKYGFENAFSEDERKVLALLYFFQGFVNVVALQVMGEPDWEFAVPALRDQTRKNLVLLLYRPAEAGLLEALGGDCYAIHPALPWFFKGLYDRFYSQDPLPERAFVGALISAATYYNNQNENGNRDVIGPLTWEESNLLHARRLARANGWWHLVLGPMQGLRILYEHTGRRADWKRLVDEVVPDFVDLANDGPVPGMEDFWGLVTNYRVRLLVEERNLTEAERLQMICVERDRELAAPCLEIPAEELDGEGGLDEVRTLFVSVELLGQIQQENGNAVCVETLQYAIKLFEGSDRGQYLAGPAFHLGHAYKNVSAIRDLEKAEMWYARSLELYGERDRQGRGRCLAQMGNVAYERLEEALSARKTNEEALTGHLNAALWRYLSALEMIPADAVDDLAVLHHQLGLVYYWAGNVDASVKHFCEAISLQERQGNIFRAAGSRFGLAIAFAQYGRVADALDYARAALRDFETYGDRAEDKIERTKGLIADLEKMS